MVPKILRFLNFEIPGILKLKGFEIEILNCRILKSIVFLHRKNFGLSKNLRILKILVLQNLHGPENQRIL